MDPFPTKGVEYLLIIGYLVVFVAFAWLLSRIGRERAAGGATGPAALEPRKTPWFQLPDAFHLHRGHTWAFPLGNKIVKIGMDDFAHRLIGEPTAFRLPEPGQRLELGEKGWQVHVNEDTVDLLSPVTGEVVDVNEEALLSPSLASEDPYGQGWLMKVRVPCDRTAVRNLLPSRLANAWTDEASTELSAMVGAKVGPVLQDGGVPVRGFARELAGDRWPEIAAKLLLTQ
jgi:glycine cleavage system H lipoate-binding protein